jgi:hypothetical protein
MYAYGNLFFFVNGVLFPLNYRCIMPKADGEAYAKGWGGGRGDKIW